jgi:hypothetical protein
MRSRCGSRASGGLTRNLEASLDYGRRLIEIGEDAGR